MQDIAWNISIYYLTFHANRAYRRHIYICLAHNTRIIFLLAFLDRMGGELGNVHYSVLHALDGITTVIARLVHIAGLRHVHMVIVIVVCTII